MALPNNQIQSPMQNLSTPKDTSQQINESTDTVYGQLNKYTSQDNNPLLKRVAMQANEKSASRGLVNSSIAIGNAQGAVIDRAGDFAKADAEIYSRRKDNNQQADTQLEATRMGNQTTLTQQSMSDASQLQNTQLQLTSSEKVAGDRIAADATNLGLELGSRERVAGLEIEATAQQSSLERQNRVFLQSMDDASRLELEKLTQESQDFRQRFDSVNSAWSNLQSGIASIDPNASSASQTTQFKRLQESFRSRMTFLNTIGGYTPGSTPSGSLVSGLPTSGAVEPVLARDPTPAPAPTSTPRNNTPYFNQDQSDYWNSMP